MQVIVSGLTLVKGERRKEVNYVGTLENDGYIYFNDNISYRVPTPATITEDTKPALSGVQIYYPARKCWIRANYFIGLTAYFFDIENVYDRLDNLETRVSSLETRVANLETRVSNLEGRVSRLEERMTDAELRISECEERLTDAELRISECENRLDSLEVRMTDAENYISSVDVALQDLILDIGPFMTSFVLPDGFGTLTDWLLDFYSRFSVIETYLGRFYDDLQLYSYDSSESTLYYRDLRAWMVSVKEMLRLSGRAERANSANINGLTQRMMSAETAIQNTTHRLNNCTHSGTTKTVEQWIWTLLNDTETNYNYITQLQSRATDLETDINGQGGILYRLNHAHQSSSGTYTLETGFNYLFDTVNNAFTDGGIVYNITEAFNKLITDTTHLAIQADSQAVAINKLGKQSLGMLYSGNNGNGVTLNQVYNKLNDVINALWYGSIGTPAPLPATSIFTNWTPIPED